MCLFPPALYVVAGLRSAVQFAIQHVACCVCVCVCVWYFRSIDDERKCLVVCFDPLFLDPIYIYIYIVGSFLRSLLGLAFLVSKFSDIRFSYFRIFVVCFRSFVQCCPQSGGSLSFYPASRFLSGVLLRVRVWFSADCSRRCDVISRVWFSIQFSVTMCWVVDNFLAPSLMIYTAFRKFSFANLS